MCGWQWEEGISGMSVQAVDGSMGRGGQWEEVQVVGRVGAVGWRMREEPVGSGESVEGGESA